MKKFTLMFGNLVSKKFILGLILIVFIIFGIIGIEVYRSNIVTQKNLKAIPNSDKEIARVGERINFTAENSEGGIKSYFWDFGDGNTSTETNPSHIFYTSNWYNVTLTIESKSGKKANSILIIGIQYNDILSEGESGRARNFMPGRGITSSHAVEIGPNIGNPTTYVQSEIYTAVGELDYRISAYREWIDDDGNYHHSSETIYSESTSTTGEDVQFNYVIRPDELPEFGHILTSGIEVSVHCSKGRWEGVVHTINAAFPMENLFRHNS